jgi:hypothetical protein
LEWVLKGILQEFSNVMHNHVVRGNWTMLSSTRLLLYMGWDVLIAEQSDSPEPWLGERITLLFCPSLPLALACSETFPRFRFLTVLLLLGEPSVVVSHTLLLCPLRRGSPLIVFPPVGARSADHKSVHR